MQKWNDATQVQAPQVWEAEERSEIKKWFWIIYGFHDHNL